MAVSGGISMSGREKENSRENTKCARLVFLPVFDGGEGGDFPFNVSWGLQERQDELHSTHPDVSPWASG